MSLKLTAYYLNRKSLLTRLLLVQQLTWAFLSTMAVLPLSLFTPISHCPVYTCHKCHINSNSLLAAHTYFDIIDVTSIMLLSVAQLFCYTMASEIWKDSMIMSRFSFLFFIKDKWLPFERITHMHKGQKVTEMEQTEVKIHVMLLIDNIRKKHGLRKYMIK